MSTTLAVETHELTRRFGVRTAVDAVSLRVPRGCVYGFLGPNGAGKTTTIKLLLGLLRPTSGRAFIGGRLQDGTDRSLLSDIGALVEGPALYSHLTALENVQVVARLRGVSSRNVFAVLERFHLDGQDRRPVRTYSTGMRQQLGLAIAWLTDPSLLILDEPSNGLDPAGTRALRTLLRTTTTERGATVFVSSHLLTEIERIADWVGILHKGRLLFQGELAALTRSMTESLEDFFLEVTDSATSAPTG
jgi:ABC-2 type transport system ATP-binding protein